MSSDQGALPFGTPAVSPAPEAPGPDPSPDASPTPLPPTDTPPDAQLAPFDITNDGDEDGITTFAGRPPFQLVADMTNMPQDAYVTGATSFARLAADDPDIGVFGGVLYQGTGWGHSTASIAGFGITHRQVAVSGQAVTRSQRDALADTYTAYNARPRYQGRITIGGREDEGAGEPLPTGLRAGQLIRITDARLPDSLNGRLWPIMRLTGRIIPAHADLIEWVVEFGDLPIQRFSEQFATHAAPEQKKNKPAPRHTIYFETLNPIPSASQYLTSQARGDDDQPVAAKGIPVHWEIISVTNLAGDDISGNGESVSPTDTQTNEDGKSTTVFTAGSETGAYYSVEASTAYQDT